MQDNILPMRFDDRQLSVSDSQFLTQKELRIKSIIMQSAIEIGRELLEVRQWFADNHKWGFEAWVQEKFGYTPRHARNFMQIAENLMDRNYSSDPLDIPFNAQLQLAKAPDPQSAIDEAAIRKQIEGEITAKKAREIADMQRAQQVARDEMRSAQDRAKAVDLQLAYYKQQLDKAQASQKTQVVEKKVEVIPEHVLNRQRELEGRVRELTAKRADLEMQAEQLKKQRDFYKRDLEKERKEDNAVFLQNLQPKADARVRANFDELMHGIVAWSASLRMKFPSVTDTQLFESEEWRRLDEAIRALDIISSELRQLKNTVEVQPQPPSQSALIVESTMAEERW